MPRAAAPAARRKPPSRQYPLEYNLLLTVTLCLLAAGAVMVYSASSAKTVLQGQGDGSTYLVRYVIYGAIGFAALHVLSRRGLAAITSFAGPLLAISFGLLVLVKVPGFGVSVNGARRWLGAGPLQFQPSELMKLALVLYAAGVIAQRPKIVKRPKQLVPIGVMVGAACILIASQPDLGTALVIAFTTAAILVAAGMPVRYLAVVFGAGFVLVSLYAISAPYRRARLTSFLDPWAHAGTSGFQAVQGQIALGSGGLLGKGPGDSTQKLFFLPEAHTDFILAIIGEELGVAGVMTVLALYGMFAYAGLRIAQRAVGTHAKLLAAGLTSLVLCQASLNVFAVMGLAPLTGVPLPFISYGSTNLVVLLAAVGLLLNIAATRGSQLKVVTGSRDREGPHRSGRNGGARGARAGGRRRAAG
jgi:cell division protein FtsW